jgi:c-di-GMP-binding flagellar brake protein YcgR
MAEPMERRKYARINKKMVIYVVYRDMQHGRNIQVEEHTLTEDIGAGGARIVLPSGLPKDKPLNLKVFLFSDPLPLPAKGKVVWSEEKQRIEIKANSHSKSDSEKRYWIGIQFVEIDPFTLERILQLIKREIMGERKD